MAAPAPFREHELAPPGRRFTRRIIADWDPDESPKHYGHDFLPIDGCVKIPERVQELMATRSQFGMMVSVSWRADRDGKEVTYDITHPMFRVSPATLGADYTYRNLSLIHI